MAATNTDLEAFLITWGTWTRDCSVPTSRILFPVTVTIDLGVDVTALKDTIKAVASFIGNDKLDKLVGKVQKILPSGKASFEVTIFPEAGTLPCEGDPPMQGVFASIVAKITFMVDVTAGAITTRIRVKVTENLVTMGPEYCSCTPKQTALLFGTPTGELISYKPDLLLTAKPLATATVEPGGHHHGGEKPVTEAPLPDKGNVCVKGVVIA